MTRQIRIWILLALLVVGTTSVLALPPNEVWTEYYRDASYAELVGERVLFCNGQRWSWGITTSYYFTWSTPC